MASCLIFKGGVYRFVSATLHISQNRLRDETEASVVCSSPNKQKHFHLEKDASFITRLSCNAQIMNNIFNNVSNNVFNYFLHRCFNKYRKTMGLEFQDTQNRLKTLSYTLLLFLKVPDELFRYVYLYSRAWDEQVMLRAEMYGCQPSE